MNEQLFDAMLRTALEEVLEEDCREAPAEQKHTGHTSLRQRRRMRRMLADPWGYERRSRAAKQMEAQQKMQVKTPVRHLRWPVLAAAVLLLTVSVTGYALRGGAFFQSFFEKSPWAEDYAGTADTEQLTELGGTGIGAVAEDEHLRLELLDAISEGENALAAVRVTVKDTELLEKYGIERLAFLNIEGSFFDSGSSSVSWTYPVDDHSLDNNQYLMIIGSSQNEADTKRECDITFRDLGLVEYTGENESVRQETVLLSGPWTLRMTLHFDGGIVAAENQTLRLPEMTLTVKEVRISALSLSMSICGGEEADTDALFDLLREATLRMKDGKSLKTVGFQAGGSAADCEVGYEFALPVDRTEIAAIEIGGQELLLQP